MIEKGSEKNTKVHKWSVTRISAVSTVILITLLLVSFALTMISMNRIQRQIETIAKHPFVVTRDMGKIKLFVAKMQVYSERLQFYNTSKDVELVKKSFDDLYLQTGEYLKEVKELYLGPAEDTAALMHNFEKLKIAQQSLLKYAVLADRSLSDITSYEQKYVHPLYAEFEELSETILVFAQKKLESISQFSDVLRGRTCILLSVIVFSTALILLLYQIILKKKNQEIEYKNQQFDIISRTIDETFLIFDASGNICDLVSGNSREVLGLSASELEKERSKLYQYMDEETQKNITAKLYQLDPGVPWETSFQYKNPLTHKESLMNIRYYQVSAVKSGHKYVAIVRDQTEELTARKVLQEALLNANNANNAKRDFLSRMSHEIRTPMNAIIGMTTIAAASIEDTARVEECLVKIGHSSKHLLMLLNDILDMSKIESNKLKINAEPFDLFELINELVSNIYPQTKDKGLVFENKIQDFKDNTSYVGDSLRLNQILLNLISNAVKFTPAGGKVALEVRRIQRKMASNEKEGCDRIRFTVTDTGIGMNKDALERVFNPFEQADTTISQKYGGTGLGMSITRNLVILMDGFLDVKSQQGKGTVCTVELNFEHSDVMLNLPVDMEAEELEVLKVLIADDDKDICEHTAMLLSNMNIRAEWVLSGAFAAAKVITAHRSGNDFDVCFIDLKLQDMDGIETTRQIRREIGSDTPIIIISAYDYSHVETKAREAGVTAFVTKPLFMSSLYNTLVNVTKGSFGRQPAVSQTGGEDLKDRRILIAEDNMLNLEIAEELLRMNGALVESAKNGKVAFEKFMSAGEHYYDAILMDIQMPIMDGYEAARMIRTSGHPSAETIPIIAATANAFTEDVAAALAAGMNAHVSKPVSMKELCRVLTQAFAGEV